MRRVGGRLSIVVPGVSYAHQMHNTRICAEGCKSGASRAHIRMSGASRAHIRVMSNEKVCV